MRIGLIDADGHNGFPNLALMKLAGFHRANGDKVEFVDFLQRYDRVYQSKVFTFTPDVQTLVMTGELIKGGTGYGLYGELFCEDAAPDYSLYPSFPHALGFLTRGCIRRCPWCIVPRKEGNIRPAADIEQILRGRESAVLMDNNILAAGDHGMTQLEQIARLGCRVDFNQGLDARLVTEENAALLARIKWLRYIRFACDTRAALHPLTVALEKLNRRGVKNYRVFVYVLVKDIADAQFRCEALKKLGAVPFAQPYRDFTADGEPTVEQRRFARWVNHKAIFKSCRWEEYH
jgi:hypothetical protein